MTENTYLTNMLLLVLLFSITLNKKAAGNYVTGPLHTRYIKMHERFEKRATNYNTLCLKTAFFLLTCIYSEFTMHLSLILSNDMLSLDKLFND